MENLLKIQAELKCPKGSVNKFGGYKYRSAEQILESVKPLLQKYGAILLLCDNITQVGDKLFLKATATLIIDGNTIEVSGFAELSEHKGMSGEQCTGTASSYARKYALNGLFLIDETESDPDSMRGQKTLTEEQFVRACQAIDKGDYSVEALKKDYSLTKEQLTEIDNWINS